MIIRPAVAADMAEITEIVRLAFRSDNEAELVRALHADGDATISLVGEAETDLAGHVLFSRMTVSADGAAIAAAGLAPVAVRPALQRQGIGGSLIRAGLAVAAHMQTRIVFVLGDPRYYRRFGFAPDVAAAFASPYAGAHLMAQWLGDAIQVRSGRAEYAPAFQRMGAGG